MRKSSLILCLALVAVLETLTYLPSLHAPFILDDYFNILENPDVIRVGLGHASLLALARPSLRSRRTLADVSFALNLRAFGQAPFSFHVVNLVIHILNTWLVFALILTLLQILKGRGLSTRGDLLPALAGALFWSLHPVQVQAVTYIVQRMTSLATLFYLLCLWLWLLARTQPRPTAKIGLGCLVLIAAGIGSLCKEILFTLPLAILLAEVALFVKDKALLRRWLLIAGLVLAGYAGFLIWLGPALLQQVRANVDPLASGIGGTWAGRLLTQPRVIWHYLSLLAFPHLSRLSLDPEWTLSSGLLQPWTTLPALLWLATSAGLALAWLRRRPLAAGGALFFLLALAPESMLPLDPVFDHRLYLPSTLLLGAIGAGLSRPGRLRRARLAFLGLCLVCLGILTHERNTAFRDEVRIWRDTVKKSPHQARAWTNLAAAYASESLSSRALHGYLAAVRLNPGNWNAYLNLSDLYLNSGHLAQARAAAERALALHPGQPLAMLAAAAVEGKAGNAGAALNGYRQVWEKKPADARVLEKLGEGLLEINRPDLAQDVYDKLLSLFPNRAGNYLLLGNALFYQGRFQEAAAAYGEEVARDPGAAEALNNLGMARLRLGQTEKARAAFARAAALAPGAAMYQENLCEAEFRLDHLPAAEKACRRAVALEPSQDLTWKWLGEIYLGLGQPKQALPALQQALARRPEDPEIKELLKKAEADQAP